MISKINHRLLSADLIRRLIALWGGGILLNLITWCLGYFILPTGLLSNIFPALNLPFDNRSIVSIFLNIFLFNLLLGGGSIVLANLFRIGELPLGYVLVLYHWALFGLFMGTDSFGIPHGCKITPHLCRCSQAVVFMKLAPIPGWRSPQLSCLCIGRCHG